MTRVYGNCPAWMVQTFFTAMAPTHHAIDKYVGLYRNAAREGFAPTAGCIALDLKTLRRVLNRLGPHTKIVVE